MILISVSVYIDVTSNEELSQIFVLLTGYFKYLCIKADIDIGGTKFKFDHLLDTLCYWTHSVTGHNLLLDTICYWIQSVTGKVTVY